MAEKYCSTCFKTGEELDAALTKAMECNDNAERAEAAAVAAKASKEAAATSETNAKTSETKAKESQTAAELAKADAEKARDEAKGIAGGDFLLKSGGTMKGELVPAGGMPYVGKEKYVAYPSGGVMYDSAHNKYGYLKILIPAGIGDSLVRFTVVTRNYVSNAQADYVVGGYIYGGTWTNTTAYCVAPPTFANANLPVHFGIVDIDGEQRYCVAIGAETTKWSAVTAAITDVVTGHGRTALEFWNDGWEVILTEDLGNYTNSKTITNTNITKGLTAADVGAPTVAEMNAAIAAIPTPDVSGQINTHNADVNAHQGTLAPMYTYGTDDLEAGVTPLETGKLHFVYE